VEPAPPVFGHGDVFGADAPPVPGGIGPGRSRRGRLGPSRHPGARRRWEPRRPGPPVSPTVPVLLCRPARGACAHRWVARTAPDRSRGARGPASHDAMSGVW